MSGRLDAKNFIGSPFTSDPRQIVEENAAIHDRRTPSRITVAANGLPDSIAGELVVVTTIVRRILRRASG